VEDIEFSPGFCRFIQTAITAVDAAELLLLFHAQPQVALTIEEAAGKLGPGVAQVEIARHLEVFEARGLISRDALRYRYLPGSPDAEYVARLAQAYAQRPVTLVRIIYALRDSKIQSFADAFKLRK